jgi:hypothetical protein
MVKLNYTKLMALNPFLLDTITNDLGQKVDLYEHPTGGDSFPVIAVIEEFKEAVDTGFFDTEDFYEGSDYTPVYKNGKIDCSFEFEL